MDRRTLLGNAAKLTLLAPFSQLARGADRADSRFVLVILRGGLDGLAAVPPYGEGRYAGLRGLLALDASGSAGSLLPLDSLFGLHPALTNLHSMYGDGELAVLHAVATPYRERSHFDGQKVLESGGISPSGASLGWLNRALSELTRAGAPTDGIALADTVPLVMRGPFVVSAWTPSRLPDADDDTIDRIEQLYAAVDSNLATNLIEARHARAVAGDAAADQMRGGGGRRLMPLATAAARFLSEPEGPRIAVIDIDGWDTHANQGADRGTLAGRLGSLDEGIGALRDELGAHWATTSVLVVTEFGRTVAVNGTRGTDHGTAGCAFLAGGAVRGGRVIADWPGLASSQLYEGRDLRPTLDLRAVAKGILNGQFGLSEAALAAVFPDSERVEPLELIA